VTHGFGVGFGVVLSTLLGLIDVVSPRHRILYPLSRIVILTVGCHRQVNLLGLGSPTESIVSEGWVSG
jgi:hypothetical protein